MINSESSWMQVCATMRQAHSDGLESYTPDVRRPRTEIIIHVYYNPPPPLLKSKV